MPSIDTREERFYAIERIVDTRNNPNGQWECLIKWKDYPESENSWQTVDNLYSKGKPPSSIATNADAPSPVPVPMDVEPTSSGDDEYIDVLETSESAVPSGDNVQTSRNESIDPLTRIASKRHMKGGEISGGRLAKKRARKPDTPLIDPKQQQPIKRRRHQTSDTTDIDATASTSTEVTIDRIQNMRKRNNRHEYLVTWTTGNDEWIGRDLMTTKYPQQLIAYFQSILHFKQTPQPKTS